MSDVKRSIPGFHCPRCRSEDKNFLTEHECFRYSHRNDYLHATTSIWSYTLFCTCWKCVQHRNENKLLDWIKYVTDENKRITEQRSARTRLSESK